MFPSRYVTATHAATGYAHTHPHATPAAPVVILTDEAPALWRAGAGAPGSDRMARLAALVAKLRRR